ncbi:hypothetical protein D9M68_689270 [compost metagenome]
MGQRVAELDVLGFEALDQFVCNRNGVGLGIEFLSVWNHARIGVPFVDLLNSRGQETASTRRAVVHGAHHARTIERLMVGREYESGGQAHHIARGEVLASVVIGRLGKLANQVFKDQPHFVVADNVRMQVDGSELLGDQIEQIGLLQLFQPAVKCEVLEHLTSVGGILGDVIVQVGAGAGGADAGQGKLRDVVEGSAGCCGQDQVHVHTAGVHGFVLAADLVTGRLQHALQSAQNGERKYDAAVLRGFEGAQQQIGDVPDKRGQGLLVHAVFLSRGGSDA